MYEQQSVTIQKLLNQILKEYQPKKYMMKVSFSIETEINAKSASFDFLASEPDLYKLDDLKEFYRSVK